MLKEEQERSMSSSTIIVLILIDFSIFVSIIITSTLSPDWLVAIPNSSALYITSKN